MNSRSAAYRPARSNKIIGGAITVGALALVAIGLSLMPWPRFVTQLLPGSGWPMAAILVGAGLLVVRLGGGGQWLPDWGDPRSAARFAAGVLVAQAAMHIAAGLGY